MIETTVTTRKKKKQLTVNIFNNKTYSIWNHVFLYCNHREHSPSSDSVYCLRFRSDK